MSVGGAGRAAGVDNARSDISFIYRTMKRIVVQKRVGRHPNRQIRLMVVGNRLVIFN